MVTEHSQSFRGVRRAEQEVVQDAIFVRLFAEKLIDGVEAAGDGWHERAGLQNFAVLIPPGIFLQGPHQRIAQQSGCFAVVIGKEAHCVGVGEQLSEAFVATLSLHPFRLFAYRIQGD